MQVPFTTSLNEKVAFIAFIAMFPLLFFIYSSIGVTGLGSQYSGISGLIAISCICILLLPSFKTIHSLRGKPLLFLLLLFSFVVLIILYATTHYLFDGSISRSYVTFIATYLLYITCHFLIGINLRPTPFNKRILYLSLLIMFTFIVFNINSTSMVFDISSGKQDGIVSYQGFARYFSSTALVTIAITKAYIRKALIIFIACIGLFFLGSRSDLFGFLFIIPIFFIDFSSNIKTLKNILMSIIFFTVLTATAGILFQDSFLSKIENNRALEVMDLTQSSSWKSRNTLEEEAKAAILQSPIIGDYAGQVKSTGNAGNYVHNFLSAWRQFGLLGFLLFISICTYSLYISIKYTFTYRQTEPLVLLGLYINLYSFFLLLFSKSVFWFYPALGWGLSLAIMAKIKLKLPINS